MAQISNTNGRERGRKGKPARMNLRVDFTPMVDMNMLLITFFMFCTTLSIPQVMDVVLPTKEKIVDVPNAIPESKTITLLLGENDKVYYYFGKPDYGNSSTLNTTDFSESGLRNILLDRNRSLVAKSIDLKRKRLHKEISDMDFKQQMDALKKSDESIIVVIKPTEASSFKNLVDALDEMQICNVAKYAIVEPAKGDKFLLENFNKKII
ncbi:MAG: ExbD/TolR family protein [Dysgonomonas sp.]